jgi:hypothetical protein
VFEKKFENFLENCLKGCAIVNYSLGICKLVCLNRNWPLIFIFER